MAKRRTSHQRPAGQPIDHQVIADALGGELRGPIDAPAGQIAAPQIAANMAAKLKPAAAPAPLIQLTRNVGPHQLGETFRLTPDLVKRLKLQPGDYRELSAAAEQAADHVPEGIDPAAWITAKRAGKTAQAQRTVTKNAEPDIRHRQAHGPGLDDG